MVKVRSIIALVALFVFFLSATLPVGASETVVKAVAAPVVQSSNGCGPEGFGGLVPDLWFTSACDRHDICYGTPGAVKSTCDSRFYDDMRAICSSRYPRWYQAIQRNACYASAWTYYQTVKQFGQSAFDNAQR